LDNRFIIAAKGERICEEAACNVLLFYLHSVVDYFLWFKYTTIAAKLLTLWYAYVLHLFRRLLYKDDYSAFYIFSLIVISNHCHV